MLSKEFRGIMSGLRVAVTPGYSSFSLGREDSLSTLWQPKHVHSSLGLAVKKDPKT